VMTAQIMAWMRDCKDQGHFNSSKRRDYGAAWDVILGQCQRAWPHVPWTKKTIAAKYDTEKRRYQAFKTLLEEFSGVTYNYETSLPEAAETTWEAFLGKNNTKHRDFSWLRRVPLGNREVYEVVFWQERATEFDIAEAGDSAITSTTPHHVDDDDDSGRDTAELLDADDDSIAGEIFEAMAAEGSTSSAPVTPTPSLRLTAAQRHHLKTDPDQTPPRNDTPPVMVSSRPKKRSQQSDGTVFGESLYEAAAILAAPRLPGAADLELALEDIQQVFAGELTDLEMFNCCEYIQMNPIRAAGWNKLGITVKRLYVERWKSGT